MLKGWPADLRAVHRQRDLPARAGRPAAAAVRHQAAGRGPDAPGRRPHPGADRVPAADDEPVGDDAAPPGCARTSRPFLPALRRIARRHPRRPRARRGPRARPERAGAQGPLRVAAQALRQGAAAGRRARRPARRGARRPPPARPLRPRHDHGHVAVRARSPACRSRSPGTPRTSTRPSLNPAGLLRRKLRAARFAVTCTEANARHLKAIAPEAVVHRVYHGLNADFSRLMGEERAAAAPGPNGKLRLLGVGRLVAKKGFDVLVEACGELDRRGVPFEAVIVGARRRRRAGAAPAHRRARPRRPHPAPGPDEPGGALRRVPPRVRVLPAVPDPRQRRPRRHPERPRRGDGRRHAGRDDADLRHPRDRPRRRQRPARRARRRRRGRRRRRAPARGRRPGAPDLAARRGRRSPASSTASGSPAPCRRCSAR